MNSTSTSSSHQNINQEPNPPDRPTESNNTMEVDSQTQPTYRDRLIRYMIYQNHLFQEEVFFSLKKNSKVQTFEDILEAIRGDKVLLEAFSTTVLRLAEPKKATGWTSLGQTKRAAKKVSHNMVKIYNNSHISNGKSIHPSKNMDISILGNITNEYAALQAATNKAPTNTAEVFKVKQNKSSWKTVELSKEDLSKYADGELSVSSLHYQPMQHRYLYFRFKGKNNVAVRLSKTFLPNLKIDLKFVSWIEHIRIDNAPRLELIVRNCVSEEIISKVSNYLTYRPELCPEQIINGATVEQVVPKPQKDYLKRVLVTVEKLELLNFRLQCRKFLEKIHVLVTDESKVTSMSQPKEEVTTSATTQLAPLAPVTSVAVPTDAVKPLETKKPAANAKPKSTKEDKGGKVAKTAKVVAKPKTTKKSQKEEPSTEQLRKQYIKDYMSGKQPVNEEAELVYGAMQASGAIFGDDDFEDL